MNTRHFHYLVTIDDFRNLTKAANALKISQPALSKFLTNCEKAFGFPLFIRDPKQLIPTTLGRQVIVYAHKVLDEKNRMLLTMQKVTNSNKNRIRLATSKNRGAIIYSKIYSEFSRNYPDTSLELIELLAIEQPKAIHLREVDIALGSGVISSKVEDIPFAYEELLISVPISHPLSKNKAIHLPDLMDSPFVLQSKNHSIRILADKLFKEAGFEPLIAFESDNVFLIDSMLRQAAGVGFVSQTHVTPCDEVSYIPLDPPVYQQLHIRYPLNYKLNEAEKFLIKLIIKERLDDPRYEAIHSAQTDDLLNVTQSSYKEEEQTSSSNKLSSHTNPQSSKDLHFETKILEYIIAITEEKSLSAAAESFFLAQPALSRHLKNIEEMIGMKLFTREHNQLQSTNAGKVFVNHARNILHIENEMFSHISSCRARQKDIFYIYCDSLISEQIRPQLSKILNEKFPDIKFIIQDSERESIIDSLLNTSIDVGLFFTDNSTIQMLNTKIIKTTELVYFHKHTNMQETMSSITNTQKPNPENAIVAPKNTSLRKDQELLYSKYFSEYPNIVCEATLPIIQRLISISEANTILPLNLIEKKYHNNYLSFDPPQQYHFVIATHKGHKSPKPSKDIFALIEYSIKELTLW